MRPKSRTSCDRVVVQHAQGTKVHALRIVPAGEAEAVVGVEPTVVGVAARIGGVEYGVHGGLC